MNDQYPQNSQPTAPQPMGTPPQNQRFKNLKGILSTLAIFLIVPFIAVMMTVFVFQSYEVDGQSMENTLQSNDKLIVYKLPKTWASIWHKSYIPKREEIIVFTKHEDLGGITTKRQLIKRVIGLPGDHVIVKNGKVTIYNNENPNGFDPDKDQVHTKYAPITEGEVDITVKSGQVFVMGDNRPNSQDSRSFGPIDASDITGKLVLRIFPLNHFEGF
jgi:signal peptidase I